MEEFQISMRLRDLGLLSTEIEQVQASIYRSPFQPFVPIVFGSRD
jgi:hypothetical protein